MANLTLVIDDEHLRAARIRAIHEDTSVNRLVREWIADYAHLQDERAQTMAGMLELARSSTSSSGPEGRTWTRDELYDRGSR
ncbi:MAG: hypothetical protein FWD59_06495 [Micrococcales bacterium]|nr:hypothetical protein [Micrococcales bacterium]